MDNDLQAKVQQRLAELPESIRQAIQAADFDQKMQEIVQRHKLHIDQAGTLGDETLMVMMGFIPTHEFAATIEQQLRVSKEESVAIAKDVSDTLFASIREGMQQFAASQTATASTPAATLSAATTPASVPTKTVDVAAETMLAQPTASTTSTTEEKPPVKIDPYREPLE